MTELKKTMAQRKNVKVQIFFENRRIIFGSFACPFVFINYLFWMNQGSNGGSRLILWYSDETKLLKLMFSLSRHWDQSAIIFPLFHKHKLHSVTAFCSIYNALP